MIPTLVFLALSVAGAVVCLVAAARNDEVCRFRMWVLYRSRYDFDREEHIEYAMLPSYDEMVHQFWRPMRSFLPPDVLDFLKNRAPRPNIRDTQAYMAWCRGE